TTLPALNALLSAHARKRGVKLKIFQSNHEGELIDFIHRYRLQAQGIVINPAAYTHYSYALRDAIRSVEIPTVEVHLSAIHRRERFRRLSVISPVCLKQISGLGPLSYVKGLDFLMQHHRRSLMPALKKKI